MSKIKDHPVSEIFPILGKDELEELAGDISKQGLLEEIDLYEGMILDGRNRYRACLSVKVDPRFRNWEVNGTTPLEFVISKNLHRRHLTVAQRAALGVKLLPLLEEQALERKAAGGREAGRSRPKDVTNSSHPFRRGPISRKQAADLVSVGETSIAAAKLIHDRSLPTFEAMQRGELSVNAAAVEAGVATGTYTKKKGGERKKRKLGATPANNIHQAAFTTGLAYSVLGVFDLIPDQEISELILHAEKALEQWKDILEKLIERKV